MSYNSEENTRWYLAWISKAFGVEVGLVNDMKFQKGKGKKEGVGEREKEIKGLVADSASLNHGLHRIEKRSNSNE